MELLCIDRPCVSRAENAFCAQHMKMEGSRPAEERAGTAVPDRNSKRISLFDRRDDVTVKVHQFETKALHFSPDVVQRLIEKSTSIFRDRLLGQLFQTFSAVIDHLLGTQPQLIHKELRAGRPAGGGDNFL